MENNKLNIFEWLVQKGKTKIEFCKEVGCGYDTLRKANRGIPICSKIALRMRILTEGAVIPLDVPRGAPRLTNSSTGNPKKLMTKIRE